MPFGSKMAKIMDLKSVSRIMKIVYSSHYSFTTTEPLFCSFIFCMVFYGLLLFLKVHKHLLGDSDQLNE